MRNKAKIPFARQLRRTMTEFERKLWFRLRRHDLGGFRFRRQHPIGAYVVDFVCLDRKLVVELDGSQHLDSHHDHVRDAWLADQGFRVLRFWNDDVSTRHDEVLEQILRGLNS